MITDPICFLIALAETAETYRAIGERIQQDVDSITMVKLLVHLLIICMHKVSLKSKKKVLLNEDE